MHLNAPVDAALVLRERPDAVVVATGGQPRSDGLQLSTPAGPVPGFDRAHVHPSWSLFGVGRPPALTGPAVVYDDTGTFEAISATDVLLEAGLEVTLVSRFETLGGGMAYPPVTVGAARERLFANNRFRFVGGHYVRSIGPDDVEIGVLFTDRSVRVPARLVIFVGFNEPNRELIETLAGTGVPCHPIGDVLGRNSIMNAMRRARRWGGRSDGSTSLWERSGRDPDRDREVAPTRLRSYPRISSVAYAACSSTWQNSCWKRHRPSIRR